MKSHATAAYTRAADPTPLAAVRPGAAAAAVAGCLAVGGGTTLCVTQGVDPIGGLAQRRLAGPPSEASEAVQAAGTAQARSASPGLDDGSAGSPDSDGSTARAVAGANR